ncbi:MAG: gliding motility-associated ABC transporter substrate-binding protein GldG [Bacteroidales bacterium]|nr:gliding motility-associated ABC transporter substrate-binding protein GldG [Bacteroidales bacterium]
MSEKKKKNIKRENIFQLLLSIVIIILLNVIGSYWYTRFDLTSENRYSLSDATKEMVEELDDIVYFKVYLEGEFPAGFKRLRNETREMLNEFRAYNNNIQYEFIDPSAQDTEEERRKVYEQLVRQGLNPTDLQVRDKGGQSQQIVFPGALVSYKNKTLPLELLQSQQGKPPQEVLNNSIQELEYNIANVIQKLVIDSKPKVAFITGHGELAKNYVEDVTNALGEYYQVERVKTAGKIYSLAERDTVNEATGEMAVRNKFEAIIIAQPDSAFSEKDKYIIDQFLMRGGKALWLIDPVHATMDSLQRSGETVAVAKEMNLNDQLFKYGVRLNDNLVLDLNALPIPIVTGRMGNQPKQEFLPWYFFPILNPSSDHPIVKNLNAIKSEFISSLDTIGQPNIKKTFLLHTSNYTQVREAPVYVSLQLMQNPPDERAYTDPPQPVAVLLEGVFESLYRNRIAKEIKENEAFGFREMSDTTKMIVVADGDIIKNQLHYSKGYPLPLGYDQYTRRTFGNKDFILNAMNYLVEESGLVTVRSKDFRLRMLDKTKVQQEKLQWQLINTIIPVMLVVIFGLIQTYVRRRKYTKPVERKRQ